MAEEGHRRALEVQGRARRRQRDERYFLWLRQLLEWQQEVRDPQEFLQNLKIELYPEEVYIFTPKGEVKSLPRDATPVDFAYAIHTDVGHQCVGARVNGKMVPLRTQLQNGDIVEIVTHRRAQAEPRLAELRRHLARPRQDPALHPGARRSSRSIELGRKLFEKEARRFDAERRRRCSSSEALRQVGRRVRAVEAGRPVRGDRLRQAVGASRCSSKLVPQEQLQEKAPDDRHRRRSVRRVLGARRGEDQGPRRRRPDGVPGAVLQPDPRRADRRLHHPRQGRLGPLRDLSQRRQPALRPGAAHRGRVGQGHRRRRPTPCG